MIPPIEKPPVAAENYLHEFLRIFFANYRLILKVFLAFAISACLLPLVLTKKYDVPAEVIVLSKKLSQNDPSDAALKQESTKYVPPSISDMETESNILRSHGLIRITVADLYASGRYDDLDGAFKRYVIKPLKQSLLLPIRRDVIRPLRSALGMESDCEDQSGIALRNSDGFQQARTIQTQCNSDSEIDALTDEAVESLTVETVPGSNVISVVFRFPDAAFGKTFVDALLDHYLEKRFQLQSNELPSSFYEEKRAQYQTRLEQLEARRTQILDSVGATSPVEELKLLIESVSQDSGTLNNARDHRAVQSMWLDYLKERLAAAKALSVQNFSFPFTFSNTASGVAYDDKEIRSMGDNLSQLIIQYGNQAGTYRSDSSRMVQLSEQIARARSQFVMTVEGRIRERERELAILSSGIAKKEERIASAQTRTRQIRSIQPFLKQLDTEIDALHEAFGSYTQRSEESRTNQTFDNLILSNSRVLSRPFIPTEAAFPKPKVIVLLGLFTALLLAVAAGYLREFFDHTFKHSSQVSKRLGLPVLLTLDDLDEQQPIADDLKEMFWRMWFWKHRKE